MRNLNVIMYLVVVSSLVALSGTDAQAYVRDSVLLTIPERMYSLDVHSRNTSSDWSMIWNYGDNDGYVEARICRTGGERMDDIFRYTSQVSLSTVTSAGRTEFLRKELNHSGKDVSIRLICQDNIYTLSCGDGTRIDIDLGTVRTTFPKANTDILIRENVAGERIHNYVQSLYAPVPVIYPTGIEELEQRFESSSDPLEGFWEYMDCDIDEPSVQLGGFYHFALVASDGGGYDIVLTGGVGKYRQEWPKMRVKGHLRPTVFANQFDLEWIDGTSRRVFSEETSATLDSNGVLTLSFPLFKSSIRLRRSQ